MTQPTIGIALGAGGARGLVHIHILQALDELGITPVCMSGTSIGAILSAGYASGLTAQEIEDYTRKRFADRWKLLADLWKLRPDSVKTFMSDGGPRFGEINIERVLDIFLPPNVCDNFADLKIPLHIVATDYYAHCDKIFTQGPLRSAIAASAAIPAVFLPVKIDGTVLIDGGMTNPTPFDLLNGKADIIVAIDVAGGPNVDNGQGSSKRPNKIDVMYASPQLMQLTIANEKAKTNQLDLLVRPEMGKVRALDFIKTKQILDSTADLKDTFKRDLMNVMDNFKSS
ncbi:MAG: patatin-like phospholipase family protein [Rhizobiales bacterium]|nr:patatin-like phospholipase family protein [Hyphomicrobiales bacterium]